MEQKDFFLGAVALFARSLPEQDDRGEQIGLGGAEDGGDIVGEGAGGQPGVSVPRNEC